MNGPPRRVSNSVDNGQQQLCFPVVAISPAAVCHCRNCRAFFACWCAKDDDGTTCCYGGWKQQRCTWARRQRAAGPRSAWRSWTRVGRRWRPSAHGDWFHHHICAQLRDDDNNAGTCSCSAFAAFGTTARASARQACWSRRPRRRQRRRRRRARRMHRHHWFAQTDKEGRCHERGHGGWQDIQSAFEQ